MNRRWLRVVVAVLWFWAGWALGNILAFCLGISPALGPLLGAALCGLIGGDPFHLIWWQKAERHAPSGVAHSSDDKAGTRRNDVGTAPSA